jgi:hypothetical protein
MTYCTIDDTGALLTYIDGNNMKRQAAFSGNCPIDIMVNDINKEAFSFAGDKLLNHLSPGDIINVSCTGTFRQIGNNPSSELPCTYIIENATIVGNQLRSEFDSNYSDNTGDMEFFIDYRSVDNIIRVYSSGNLIFKDIQKSPISYRVDCIKQHCPDGFCECKQDAYPGYCCVDCRDTANKIHGMTEQLRGMNGK